MGFTKPQHYLMCIGNPFVLGWAPEYLPLDPISVSGALPCIRPPTPSPFITFRFASFSPTIFNCTITGPSTDHSYRITTDPAMPDYTVLKNAQDKSLALIEWQDHPLVELRGALSKKGVVEWLKLSPDKSSRSMEVRGEVYTWTPCDNFVCLYAPGPTPVPIARISRSYGSVNLDMTPQAIQLDLLEHCLTAAFLLQCGRNID